MTFQPPPNIRPAPLEWIESIDTKLDEAKWYFYRYVNDQCPAWPSLLASTNREKTKLLNIISDVTAMLYTPHGPQITAPRVLEQYGRFVTWREELPGRIGNIESNNSQALPHVLSLL